MKIKLPQNKQGKTTFFAPPIPFVREEIKQASKVNAITLKLKVTPTNNDSSTYELTVPFFSDGTGQAALDVRANLLKIFTGQNITTGPDQCRIVRAILKGDALNAFNQKMTDLGSETTNNCATALKEVVTNALPKKALLKQKRAMRKHFRFQAGMTIKGYVARFIELNDLLAQFPDNFSDEQKINNEELLDIMMSGLPKVYQDKLTMEGFDPYGDNVDIATFRTICERVEETQGNNWQQHAPQPAKKPKHQQEHNNKRKKYCENHGHCAHSTTECRDLPQEDKDKNKENKKARYQNKTWTRQDVQKKSHQDVKAFSPMDMNAFIEQRIEQRVAQTVQEAVSKIQQQSYKGFAPKNQEELDNFNFDKLNVSSDEEIET